MSSHYMLNIQKRIEYQKGNHRKMNKKKELIDKMKEEIASFWDEIHKLTETIIQSKNNIKIKCILPVMLIYKIILRNLKLENQINQRILISSN